MATLASFIVFWSAGIVATAARGDAARKPVPVLVDAFVLWFFTIIASGCIVSALHVFSAATMIGLPLVAAISGLLVVTVQQGSAALANHHRALWMGVRRVLQGLWRAGRLAGWPLAIVVVTAVALAAYFWFAAYVSPPRGNMDTMYYHEPIIGFTFQMGGWGAVDLPGNLQRINGMPRMCHMVYLWFAAFDGRELTELPNSIGNVLGVLSVYGLARHVGVQKSVSMGWAFCWLLAPGMLRLTTGLMVDPLSSALVAAATYAVVVPRLTPWSVGVAAAACSMTIGTKFHVLPISFVLSVALLWRLLRHRRAWSPRVWWGTGIGAAVVIFLGLAAVYGRNIYYFGNPIWPAGLKLPGLKLKAAYDMKNALISGKALSSFTALSNMLAAPYTERAWGGPAARFEDYGVGGVFLVWPLALLGCAVAILRGLSAKKTHTASTSSWGHKVRSWGGGKNLFAVGLLVALCVVSLATFPSVVRGRYYMPTWVGFIVVAAWLTRHPRRRDLARQLAFAVGLLSVISAVWIARLPMYPLPSQIWKRLQVSQAERDYTGRQLAGVTKEFGAFRHEHVTAGTKTGFDQAFQLSGLWNDDYSNEVHWLRTRTAKEAERKGYDFLFLRTGGFRKRRWDDSHWEFITKPFLKYSGRPQGTFYAYTIEARPKKPKTQPKRSKAKKARGKKAHGKTPSKAASIQPVMPGANVGRPRPKGAPTPKPSNTKPSALPTAPPRDAAR